MQHLDEGTIHAWLDGALPPLEAELVAKHAAECATCAAAVADARGIIAGSARIVSALDDVPGGVIPRQAAGSTNAPSAWRRLRLTPGRAALAATILLAVSTTLTLRSPSAPQLKSDSSVTAAAAKALERQTASPPATRTVALDSVKVPGPSSVNAPAAQKANFVVPRLQTQPVGERREVADAAAPPDTTARVLAKTRAATQEAAAGASAPVLPAAPPAAAVTAVARGTVASANVVDQRADSVSAFEGCYRLSADSSTGSADMPSGLPASFALTRPSFDSRLAARRAFATNADSGVVPVMWRQLSTTQASVTFSSGSGGARPVSLVLTAGSQVGVASSGDRTTKVRVLRTACPR